MNSQADRRIVFVTPGFSEPGGCASHGRKIAEGLADRGWRVQVITRLGSGASFQRRRSGDLSVTEIPGFGHRRLGGVLFLLLALPMVFFRRRPYAFMAMQLSSPATVAGIGALIHRCQHFLVFSTSTGPDGEAAFIRRSRTSRIRRWLLSRASVLIGQTPVAAEELIALLPRGQVEVVPTPVIVPDQPYGLTGHPNVLYTGRLVAGKNLERLLDVWAAVIQRIQGAQLILVGAGVPGDPTETELRQRTAQSSLAQAVTFTGWVSDVTSYLRRADVYVFLSDSEGMSNSLLEACALGRVVVASDIPANRAVLGDSYPLLIDPADSQSLLTAILTALTDDEARMGARKLITARMSQFSDMAVLDRIEQLLIGVR